MKNSILTFVVLLMGSLASASWPLQSVKGKTIQEVCKNQNLCSVFDKKALTDPAKFEIEKRSENELLVTYKKSTARLLYNPKQFNYFVNGRTLNLKKEMSPADLQQQIAFLLPQKISKYFSLVLESAWAQDPFPTQQLGTALLQLIFERDQNLVCQKTSRLIKACNVFAQHTKPTLNAPTEPIAENEQNRLRDIYSFQSEALHYHRSLEHNLTTYKETLFKCECSADESNCVYNKDTTDSVLYKRYQNCQTYVKDYRDSITKKYGSPDELRQRIDKLWETIKSPDSNTAQSNALPSAGPQPQNSQ